MDNVEFGNYVELVPHLAEISAIEAHFLAVRNSLRVMPLFYAEPVPKLNEKVFLLGAFRCNLMACSSHIAGAGFVADKAVQAADFLIEKINFPNELYALCAAIFCAEAVGEHKSTYLSLESSADSIKPHSLARHFWEDARDDLEALRQGGVLALIERPLWQSPEMSRSMVEIFRTNVGRLGPPWDILSQWYSEILYQGASARVREFHIVLASAQADFWKRATDDILRDISDYWFSLPRPSSLNGDPPLQHFKGKADKIDFFISYSTGNEAEAREINGYLDDAGYSTIAQFKDFAVGSNFVIEMQEGLERGARAIVLLSPDYVASDHCRAEWAALYNMDPLGKGRKLVPLLLKPASLNRLARQIVYKSLFGLKFEQRRAAVLEAIGHRAHPLPPDMLRGRLAETASPDVAPTSDGRLDVVPNAVYDRPVFDADLQDLPETLRTLCSVIQASLPDNSPRTIAPSLQAYGSHLTERGARPIVGLLAILAEALQRDVRSAEFDLWGDGLASQFTSFFSCHSKFITHFPHSQERDEVMAANEIDEDRASGKEFLQPIEKVAEAFDELNAIGGTTPAFERVIQDSLQRAKDIDSLPTESNAGDGTNVTPKRRFVFSQIGFWERILSALGSMTTLASTQQGKAAIAALSEAIKKFISFISSN